MPNGYNSEFTGQHNDAYDARISAVEAYGSRITDLETFRQTFLNMVYPIGSIYMSMNETNPGTLFGGTWERISGRFLLGGGGTGPGANNDTGFGQLTAAQQVWFSDSEPGITSGEYFHQLSVGEMPSHTHNSYGQLPRINDDSISGNKYGHTTATSWWFQGVSTSVQPNGSDVAHNNMPPFLVVAMWKRTA